MPTKQQRLPGLTIAVFGTAGLAGGFVTQVIRSGSGRPPLVPPLSFAATLVLLAAVLLLLAVLIKRSLGEDRRRPVNPFHAVRVLAAARASQLAGTLFSGFATGLALQLLTRSVPAPAATTVPTVAALVAGVILLASGLVSEHLCRIPPDDDEGQTDADPETPVDSGPADSPAFRSVSDPSSGRPQ